MKIKKGDNVVMLSGKDRGKKGKIIRTFPENGKVVIEGLNLIKKHIRARRQEQKGQIIHKERAVPVSAVAIICKSCSRPTRVGYRLENDQKVRICRKCEASI